MADLFTKSLQRLTFHCHADYLFGHVPPKYSPVHSYLLGTYSDAVIDFDEYIPPTFTMPLTAAAAKLNVDYAGNLWVSVIWHG